MKCCGFQIYVEILLIKAAFESNDPVKTKKTTYTFITFSILFHLSQTIKQLTVLRT